MTSKSSHKNIFVINYFEPITTPLIYQNKHLYLLHGSLGWMMMSTLKCFCYKAIMGLFLQYQVWTAQRENFYNSACNYCVLFCLRYDKLAKTIKLIKKDGSSTKSSEYKIGKDICWNIVWDARSKCYTVFYGLVTLAFPYVGATFYIQRWGPCVTKFSLWILLFAIKVHTAVINCFCKLMALLIVSKYLIMQQQQFLWLKL